MEIINFCSESFFPENWGFSVFQPVSVGIGVEYDHSKLTLVLPLFNLLRNKSQYGTLWTL